MLMSEKIVRFSPVAAVAGFSDEYPHASAIWREVADRLRLPDENHSAMMAGFQPLVDRFVFSDDDIDALSKSMLGRIDDGCRIFYGVRPPLAPAVYEWSNRAVYIDVDDESEDLLHAVWFEYLHGSVSPVPVIATSGPVSFDFSRWSAAPLLGQDRSDDIVRDISFNRILTMAAIFSVVGNARTAVSRRVVGGESVAARSLAMRRQQRGYPVVSFNRVSLVLPKTCEYRGVIRETASLVGMRGHLVIGHWRLIDGNPEPYWVWVDGHHRGDDKLGYVGKAREIAISPEVRRGFISPSFFGQKGQRVRALRVN